jgi:hypothetical protein
MMTLTQVSKTFPSHSIPADHGGVPVDVALIAQLGHGAGDALIASTCKRQAQHPAFVDALHEPSARLLGMHLEKGDATSVYSFLVGPEGHPFHRHAGHRIFTAISGSAGAQLRFCTLPDAAQISAESFVRAITAINVPPDCLFTVRFGGGTWHQFVPQPGRHDKHPALFALSCHSNELGGDLAPSQRAQITQNQASIASLTELLPQPLQAHLDAPQFNPATLNTVALALDAPDSSVQAKLCGAVRQATGWLRQTLNGLRFASGYKSENSGGKTAHACANPENFLLSQFLPEAEHQDCFVLEVAAAQCVSQSAAKILAALLNAFVQHPPVGVTRLMRLRNTLVAPLGLRRSELGCPVSSLLAASSESYFANQFPVIAQALSADDRCAQVILGADDKHLRFRSCVRVDVLASGAARCYLANRVHTRNYFGRFYLAAIEGVHRRYVARAMLQLAVHHALLDLQHPTFAVRSDAPMRSFAVSTER